MSLASLINQGNISGGDFGIDYTPSSIIDVTKASFNATLDNYLTTSARSLQYDQIERQYNLIQDFEKQSLEQIIGENVYNSDDRYKKTDEWILSKRQQDERYNQIPTSEEMRLAAEQKAKESYENLEQVKKGASGFESFTGELLGGIGGSLFDPVNIAVTVGSLGTGALVNSSRIGIQTAGRVIATEVVIGAGTEVVMQPFVTGWQQQIGNEYGLGDAVTNIAFAGLVSGGIASITSVPLTQGIKTARDKGSVFFETIATSDRTPAGIQPVMEKMADFARIKETNPFDGVQGSKVHADNVKMAEDAFNARQPFKPNITEDLQVRFEKELSKIDLNLDPYIQQAKQIKNDLKQAFVDINNPRELESVLGYRPKGIAQFIKEKGGINDVGGDLKALNLDKRMVGLVNKGKKGTSKLSTTATSIDTALQKAHDAGYFPQQLNLEDLEIQDLIDALNNDLNGNRVYNENTRNAIADLNKGDLSDKYYQMGITKDMSDLEIAEILKNTDNIKQFDLVESYYANKLNQEYQQDLYDTTVSGKLRQIGDDGFATPEEELRPADMRAMEQPSNDAIDTIQRVERNEFEDLLNNEPDFTVTMDDGTKVKLSDIMNDIKMNEKINDAIKVCSI